MSGADTEAKEFASSGTGVDVVTPELALVDPELAQAQRQLLERKAAMSSNLPANGAFFVDPAQPEPQPAAEPAPALVPPAPVEPAPAPVEPAPAPTPAAASALPAEEGAPMRDVPLGTLIFRAGLLAEEQLEDALQEGMRTGKRLGEVLLERGWLHERDLGRLLAGQKGLAFVEVSGSDAEPAALQRLPEEKARMQIALPLRVEDGNVVVAVSDPSNELVLENLRRALGSEPRLVVAPHSELLRAIGEAYNGAGETEPPAPVAPPEPVPQAEAPVQVPPAVEAPTPAPAQPEISIQAPPPLEPEAQPAAALSPIVEHEPAPPAAAPAVTPLPTVLPPAEERAPEASTPQVVQPLAPVAPETTEPVAVETPPLTATEPVQPVVEEPAPMPEPVVPVAPEPPTALAAEIAAAMPPPEPIPVPQAPLAPPPAEEPPPAPQPDLPPAAQGPATVHVVSLRLRDGDTIQVGTFHTAEEATARAQEVVASIAAAEGNATWPYFEHRYLRPDTIASVDLLEELAEKWLGSAVRSRWANEE